MRFCDALTRHARDGEFYAVKLINTIFDSPENGILEVCLNRNEQRVLSTCRHKELKFCLISGVEFWRTGKGGSVGKSQKARFQVPLAPPCVCACPIPRFCGAGEWAASQI